jgi:predicted nucleotidyltransferase
MLSAKLIKEILNTFPEFVRKVLAELIEEESTESVWLVGSRANQTARPDSDWDLLVFSSVEPEAISARCEKIDIIRVGPSRQGLLEGQGNNYIFSFADWQWSDIDKVNAKYIGTKLKDYPPGARDSSEQACIATEQPAYRIWAKHETI